MNSHNQGTVKILQPNEVLMSPSKVIQRFENILEKYGREKALKLTSFQKARESWIAAVFMLLFSQWTKKQYWLREDEAPDIYAYSYRNPEELNEIGVTREVQPIEIFEYPQTSEINFPRPYGRGINLFQTKFALNLFYLDPLCIF